LAEVVGCQIPGACNYDSNATDPGECTYASEGYDCDGNCLADSDGDGICDPFEVGGCTYPAACNFDAAAQEDDGSCQFASAGVDCSGQCAWDLNNNGICDNTELPGVLNTLASGGYCGPGTVWNPATEQCESNICQGDHNGDGWVGVSDLMDLLAKFESPCLP
jgi:hypothetical protein